MILVVDDEQYSRTLLSTILTSEGYRVRAAETGELALASIPIELPKLILLDIHMPRMDGFEVCRRLKHGAETRDIPVIFLGASNELRERIEGFGLGAVDFITKPFQREELLARVRTHLELGRLRARLESQVAERTAELRESEARFRTLANSAPVLIWASGLDKLCTFFNQGWLDFTGRTMEQELGDGWAAGVHPDDLDRCLATYVSSFDARQEFKMEYRLRRADQKFRWILDHGVPLFAPGGIFRGYIGSCVDITDLKTAQDEALRRQKLESVAVLAAGVAHDFNNLLGGIIADADLALDDMKTASLPVKEVQEIRQVAFRASEIVRELMVYSQQEAPDDFEPVHLSQLIQDMVELLKISVPKHITLTTDLAKNLPPVRGHGTQIRQVVMNLIINASEAIGEPQGTIGVRALLADGKELSPGSAESPAAQCVRLEVSDTGRGMTADETARIFDPYFTTKFTGRGLGLAVVQGVVRAHGGSIHVLSAPGRGTTFQILFPCWTGEVTRAPRAEVTVSPQSDDRVTGTVLVVEDQDTLRKAIVKALRIEHFSVLEAADGWAAIDLLRAGISTIDLILLDLKIPGAKSREVLEEAQRLRPGIRVVMTSANSKEAARESVSLAQSLPFIRKPFQLRDLVAMLRETLSAAGPQRVRSGGAG